MRSWLPHFRLPGVSRAIAAAWIASASMALPAFSLQVQMTVTDKLNRPVPGASICLQDDEAHCAQTDGQGKADFEPPTRIPGWMPERGRFSVTIDGGRLSIHAGEAGIAGIAFFDSRGRRVGAAFGKELSAGNTAVALPARQEGLLFFRVGFQGAELAGKAVILSGPRVGPSGVTYAGPQAEAAKVAALGKMAAANLNPLVISKQGYQDYSYRPRSDFDTGVVIRMTAAEDPGLGYVRLLKAAVTEIDSVNHVLRYSYAENGCSGDHPVTGTRNSSLPFWIAGGKWYFPAGNCQGVALQKTGNGVYGTWKTLGVENLPAGMLAKACDPGKDSLNTATVNLFFLGEGGGWDIDLRQDSMIIGLNRVACPGSQVVNDIPYFDGTAGRPLLIRNTCKEVKLKNVSGDTGAYAFRVENDSLRGSFTYQAHACQTPAVAALADLNAPKTCPETQAASIALDSAFQGCVRNTGFLPPAQ
jgi:hypothetical protein